MLTGAGIFAFAIGICKIVNTSVIIELKLMLSPDAFTIRAVSQDEFEDVIVPDKPQPSQQAGSTQHAKVV